MTTALPYLTPDAIADEAWTALFRGAAFIRADVTLVEVTGVGAVACVQGLLTNDLEHPGDESFVYGAVLTPKGMIVCDMWAIRLGSTIRLALPHDGKGAVEAILARSLPPRLARWRDRSGEITVLRLVGPRALDLAGAAGVAVPEPGRAGMAGGRDLMVGRPAHAAPFELELHVPANQAAEPVARLREAGAFESDVALLEAARILHGWPRLGAEIDEKTLPQEVRYDAIEGVSYTKGCYTGQETVSRLHFRGHTNRALVGLAWTEAPAVGEPSILQDGKNVGRVTSVAWVEPMQLYLGLGKLRRDAAQDRPVLAAGAPARVTALPFALAA